LPEETSLKMNYNHLYFGGVPNSAYFTANLVEIFGIKK
jgi:hypothetical protein